MITLTSNGVFLKGLGQNGSQSASFYSHVLTIRITPVTFVGRVRLVFELAFIVGVCKVRHTTTLLEVRIIRLIFISFSVTHLHSFIKKITLFSKILSVLGVILCEVYEPPLFKEK